MCEVTTFMFLSLCRRLEWEGPHRGRCVVLTPPPLWPCPLKSPTRSVLGLLPGLQCVCVCVYARSYVKPCVCVPPASRQHPTGSDGVPAVHHILPALYRPEESACHHHCQTVSDSVVNLLRLVLLKVVHVHVHVHDRQH